MDEDKLKGYKIPVKSKGKNPYFCGRDEIFSKIEEIFVNSKGALGRKEISLHGLGGVGKSEIALEYVHKREDMYSSVFWINVSIDSANSSTTAEQESGMVMETSARSAVHQIINHYDEGWGSSKLPNHYQTIAQRFKLFDIGISTHHDLMEAIDKSSSVELLKLWLQEDGNDRWLLILDNCNDPNYDLDKILPPTNTGHALIIGYKPNSRAGSRLVHVPEKLNPEESKNIFLKASKTSETLSEIQGSHFHPY